MRTWSFIVYQDNYPLVVITDIKICVSKDQILDWYAKLYAFDRATLDGVYMDCVNFDNTYL
jgi:hypothetical protein